MSYCSNVRFSMFVFVVDLWISRWLRIKITLFKSESALKLSPRPQTAIKTFVFVKTPRRAWNVHLKLSAHLKSSCSCQVSRFCPLWYDCEILCCGSQGERGAVWRWGWGWGGMCWMAVLWLSGSAEPEASVNVAPGEEKSLCPGLWGGGGRRKGPWGCG